MYDVTHVRVIETRLCDQKFIRMGKERLRSETSLGLGRKMASDGTPLFLECWRSRGRSAGRNVVKQCVLSVL